MDARILELSMAQVHDPDKGSFFVGLKATRSRYKGNVVYADAFGRRITVGDAENRPVTKREAL